VKNGEQDSTIGVDQEALFERLVGGQLAEDGAVRRVERRVPMLLRLLSYSRRRYDCCRSVIAFQHLHKVLSGAEVVMVVFFLINSVLLIAQRDTRYETAAGVGDGAVLGPFIACMVGLALAAIVLLLLFIGIARKHPILLIPHIILQVTQNHV
jgi:hypothetical protein